MRRSNTLPSRPFNAWQRLSVSLLAGLLSAPASADIVTRGTLSTSAGASIYDEDLVKWIDEFINNSSPRLVVLTECFGGDKVADFSASPNLGNTAIASATSPGEQATYGAYDSGASNALKPGAGRTAQDVHNGGVASKAATETPSTGGGLGLADFSLADTAAAGPVKSRHVLVYAGQPDALPGRDVDQRDRIKNAFAGQANTTVRSAGGAGAGGWDHPGSAAGLRSALKAIQSEIDGSADPSAEQFILYVTDHGDLHKQDDSPPPVIPGTAQNVYFTTCTIPGYTTAELNPIILSSDPNNQAAVEAFVALTSPQSLVPVFDAFLTPAVGAPAALTNYTLDPVDLAGASPGSLPDGIVGNAPGEGWQITFPIPEAILLNNFNASMLVSVGEDLSAFPPGTAPFQFDYIGITTGEVAKALPIPEPAALSIALVPALIGRRRRR